MIGSIALYRILHQIAAVTRQKFQGQIIHIIAGDLEFIRKTIDAEFQFSNRLSIYKGCFKFLLQLPDLKEVKIKENSAVTRRLLTMKFVMLFVDDLTSCMYVCMYVSR